MLAAAYISHQSEGRLRIRIPEKRNDVEYFSRIQETLQGMDPSVQIQVTPFTGSVLVEHRIDPENIKGRAKDEGLFDCTLSVEPPKKAIPALSDLMKKHWVPKILLGLGTLQLLRGQPLAPTSTLFMDAYRLWLANQQSK